MLVQRPALLARQNHAHTMVCIELSSQNSADVFRYSPCLLLAVSQGDTLSAWQLGQLHQVIARHAATVKVLNLKTFLVVKAHMMTVNHVWTMCMQLSWQAIHCWLSLREPMLGHLQPEWVRCNCASTIAAASLAA